MVNNTLSTNAKKVESIYFLLKLSYGLLFLIAGADKFFNLVTQWSKYVSSYALSIVSLVQHMDTRTLLDFVGIFEMILGIFILLGWTRIGGYIAALWLLIIAVNLVSTQMYFDIAVRDVIMAVGAITLARLTSVKRNML